MHPATHNVGRPASESGDLYIPIDPKCLFDDWQTARRRDFEPSPRQRLLMDAVVRALKDGLFYSEEVKSRVAELVHFDRTRSTDVLRVEGGDFGMDVYYARRAVDARATFDREAAAAAELRLRAGDRLGTLVFMDGKRTTGVTMLESVDSWTWKFEGKRGTARVTGTGSALNLKHAIERAHERGNRTDSYQEFVASREDLLTTT